MKVTIGKRFRFDAAHRLPLHDGKCSRPHGHTYILEVEVEGEVLTTQSSSQGMVLDYGDLKAVVERKILDLCDHQDLNKVLANSGQNPETHNVTTAERLVVLFSELLWSPLRVHGVSLTRVRLQETPDSWAEWRWRPQDA